MSARKWISLKTKLTLFFVILVYIPLMLGGVLIIHMSNRNSIDGYLSSSEKNLAQLSFMLNRQVSDACIYADSLAGDKVILDILTYSGTDPLQIVTYLNKTLLPRLERVIGQSSIIYNVRLLHANPAIYTVYDRIFYCEEIANGQFETRLATLAEDGQYRKNTTFIEYRPVGNVYADYPNMKMSTNIWYIYRTIYNGVFDGMNGVLEIAIPNDKMCSLFTDYSQEQEECVQLVHPDYGVIYSSLPGFEENMVDKDDFTIDQPIMVDGQRYYVQGVFVSSLQCWLVHYTSAASMSMPIKTVIFFVGILIVMLICFGAMVVLISRKTLSNLSVLTETMNSITSTSTYIRTDIRTNDEVGLLSKTFNNMINRLEQAGRTEKRLLFQQLSYQIRPHFLCNALDMIRFKSELHQAHDIASAISSISRYCQYTLRVSHDEATLREELSNAINYLNITNLIREAPIICNIDSEKVNDRLDDIKIPRFTLQPLIENCIVHGFQNKKNPCVISMNMDVTDSILTITLQDNGQGIPREKKEEILAKLSEEHALYEEDGSIGLVNTLKRLNLFYGRTCRIHIESYEGVGTQVSLMLPLDIKAE